MNKVTIYSERGFQYECIETNDNYVGTIVPELIIDKVKMQSQYGERYFTNINDLKYHLDTEIGRNKIHKSLPLLTREQIDSILTIIQ